MQTQVDPHPQDALYNILFKCSNDALTLIDPQTGRIIDCNLAAVKLHAVETRENLIGKTFKEISPEFQPDGNLSSESFKQCIQQTISRGTEICEWGFRRADASHFVVHMTLRKVQFKGTDCILATEKEAMTSQTIKSGDNTEETRLNAAQNLASLGSWELDLVNNKLWWSDEIFRIFEIDPTQFEASYEAFLNTIHPDDRDAVNQAYQNSLTNQTFYEIDHRLLLADGRVKYVHERGEHEFDANGKPLRSMGTVQDITDRKQIEIMLQASEEKHRAIFENILDGIAIAKSDSKQLIEGNTAICNMLGYSKDEFSQLNVKDIHPQSGWSYVCEQFEKQARGEIKLATDMPMERKDGSVFYTDINTSVLTINGKEYLLGVFRDITVRKETEKNLKLFRTLLDHTSDAVEVLDPLTLRFLDVNQTECRELGYTREEMLSMRVFDIDTQFNPESAKKIEEQINKTGNAQFETVHKRKDGSTFPVEVRASLVELDKSYMISIARDITDQKIAEQKLREGELAYRTLTQNLPGMVYRVFIRENAHMKFYNDLPFQITGYSEEELTNGEVCSIDPLIIDEDRPSVLEKVEAAIAEKISFSVEYRLKHKNGDIRWMREYGMPVFGEDGELLYIDGLIFDITDSKQIQESLRQSEEKFRALIESSSDWIWEVNPQGIYTYVSPQVESLLGYLPEEVLGKTPFDFMTAEEVERVGHLFAEIVEKQVPIHMLENTCLRKDGSLRILETSGVPFFDAKGAFKGYRGVDRDITERKQAEELIMHMAHYDTLTNLPNRILFLDRLKQELARARRSQHPFALLFIDLDYFKEINDTLGHSMGDILLKQVAQRLQDCVRQMDTVARIGGDEFTVLITELKAPSNAERVAQNIIKSLTEPFDIKGEKSHIGCSIGIALYPSDGTNGETLLKHADVAMYCAKKQRNTFRFFCEKPPNDKLTG